MQTLTDSERKILETFKEAFPELSEDQKNKLLWFGEGMAFKAESEDRKTG